MDHRIDPTTGEKLGYHIDVVASIYCATRPPYCVGVLREDLPSLPRLVSDWMEWPHAARIEIEDKRFDETLVMIRKAA